MLTEQFIASVGVPTKPSSASSLKDAGIFVHEYQPLNAQRLLFKKSATPPNCLAANSTHIFAAQAGKAVVHVYNREKGNQEATVPFTDKITSITFACRNTVLVLGTSEGRIFLWEIASGRQVATPPAHLQDVTVVRVDPTSNFLLSASADSTVHVWSISDLLSFSNAGLDPEPVRTFASHRSKVTALELGHSSSFCNFAVSASEDQTCLVWDYRTNNTLRTFLLSSVPISLALDPADRAIYVGQSDGSVRQIDLITDPNSQRPSVFAVQNGIKANAPIQPPQSALLKAPMSTNDAVFSLAVSFDGTNVLSGHESGTIRAWDVGRGGSPTDVLQAPLPAAVTNLFFLPVTGFLEATYVETLRVPTITKPKFGAYDSSNGSIPENYMLHAQLSSTLPGKKPSEFEQALHSTSFPAELLDRGLSELLSWGKSASRERKEASEDSDDFVPLDNDSAISSKLTKDEQTASLRAELEALRRLQRASFEKIDRLSAEKNALLQREQKRASNLNEREDEMTEMNGMNSDHSSSDDG